MATITRLMTAVEFLALPEEDGIDRGLIRGELKEQPRTTRSFALSIVIGKVWSRLIVWVDGPPVLVVEVLSPTDEQDDVADKVSEYLDAGVHIVWVIDTRFSTVIVHRPDAKPQPFNVDQEITAEPHLPGFRVPVAEFFEDLDD